MFEQKLEICLICSFYMNFTHAKRLFQLFKQFEYCLKCSASV